MQYLANCALLVLLLLTALVVAADNLPDPGVPDRIEFVTNAPVSCADKTNCRVGRIIVSPGRIAYCEFRTDDEGKRIAGRCHIDPVRAEDAE